jgi:hypothetical protein
MSNMTGEPILELSAKSFRFLLDSSGEHGILKAER